MRIGIRLHSYLAVSLKFGVSQKGKRIEGERDKKCGERERVRHRTRKSERERERDGERYIER